MGFVAIVAMIIFYALRRKGDVSASMSVLKILEFKLDAKDLTLKRSAHHLQTIHTRDYSLSPLTLSTARKASCGISTRPTRFIRFLPSFCFSSSLRLREMSPP